MLIKEIKYTQLLIWFLCTVFILSYYFKPKETPIVEDEIYWIGSSYYYDLAFIKHDWSNSDWSILPARENPPVAKYLIGLNLHLANHLVTSLDYLGSFYLIFKPVAHAWGDGKDYMKREQVVRLMNPLSVKIFNSTSKVYLDQEVLMVARREMVLFAMMTSLLILIYGYKLKNPFAALIASQLVLIHPAVIESYNHVQSDIIAMFFSTLSIYLGHILIQNLFKGYGYKLIWNTLLFSTVAALACGSKMNSLIVLIVFYVAIILCYLKYNIFNIKLKTVFLFSIYTFLCTLGVFILINPTLYNDLYSGIIGCFLEHYINESIQANFLNDHLISIANKLEAVLILTFINYKTVIVVIISIISFFKFKHHSFIYYIITWWMIAFLCVLLWIPFSRLRYIMPLVVPSSIIVSYIIFIMYSHLSNYIATKVTKKLR